MTEHDVVDAPAAEPTDRHLIVSIDSHVSPRFADLRSYCPQEHLDAWDQWSKGWLSLWGPTPNWYGDDSPIAAAWNMPFTEEIKARTAELVERAGAGIFDPAARVRDMDADGIACELIYHTAFTPDVFPFMGGTVPGDTHRALETVGVQMYNRWLADFVQAAPERFIGAAYVPIWDVDASVAELRWARDHGIGCVNFPAPNRSFAAYNDPVYEPFWATAAELDMPLTTHGGAGDLPSYSGKEAWALYCSDVFYYSRRGFMYLVWSGVFERYPALKLVFTEQRNTWVADTLAELDSVYLSGFQDLSSLIPERPSHYFRQNCWLGVSFMARFEAELADVTGDDRLMWGSDYPHFEGTWGYTEESLRQTFAKQPAGFVRKVLGENAIECFGLDGAKLRSIADRVGPQVATIDTPLERVPPVPGLSFRTLGSWA